MDAFPSREPLLYGHGSFNSVFLKFIATDFFFFKVEERIAGKNSL